MPATLWAHNTLFIEGSREKKKEKNENINFQKKIIKRILFSISEEHTLCVRGAKATTATVIKT